MPNGYGFGGPAFLSPGARYLPLLAPTRQTGYAGTGLANALRSGMLGLMMRDEADQRALERERLEQERQRETAEREAEKVALGVASEALRGAPAQQIGPPGVEIPRREADPRAAATALMETRPDLSMALMRSVQAGEQAQRQREHEVAAAEEKRAHDFALIEAKREEKTPQPYTDIGKARSDFRRGLIDAKDLEALVLKETKTGLDPEKRFANADKLRDEFVAQSKDFSKAREAFGRVLASAEEPSAAGDLALIFNYMKVLDPGSVVRESEFATAAATGSYGERIRAAVEMVVTGERLSDDMREDFVNRSRRLFNKQLGLHSQRANEYTRLAERFGLDPQDVIVDMASGFTPEELAVQESVDLEVEEDIDLGEFGGMSRDELDKVDYQSLDLDDYRKYRAAVIRSYQ